jgi:hypothetical protein
MPPKKAPAAASKKAEIKKKEKVIEVMIFLKRDEVIVFLTILN